VEQKIALKDKTKIRKQITGKFNECAHENK
jgi:hypothetical protein